jgi:hypothetical protein
MDKHNGLPDTHLAGFSPGLNSLVRSLSLTSPTLRVPRNLSRKGPGGDSSQASTGRRASVADDGDFTR